MTEGWRYKKEPMLSKKALGRLYSYRFNQIKTNDISF